MNLASCENCGVVYDKARIPFPKIYTDDGDGWSIIDCNKAKWDGDTFQAVIECSNCKVKIFYETGDKV